VQRRFPSDGATVQLNSQVTDFAGRSNTRTRKEGGSMAGNEVNVVEGDDGSLSDCDRGPCCDATPADVLCAPRRRTLLTGALVSSVALSAPRVAFAADPRMARPQAGDLFVFATGAKARAVITEADLRSGGPPVVAWPMDPASKTIRDGSRLNQVLIVRLETSGFDETTRERAAEGGFLAYSASCTHAQCPVTGWRPDRRVILCPCHNSEFDPSLGAKVVSGPAPRPLPALPLKAVDGTPVATGGFTGKVGMTSS
jgi:Rieske Fe-S protein